MQAERWDCTSLRKSPEKHIKEDAIRLRRKDERLHLSHSNGRGSSRSRMSENDPEEHTEQHVEPRDTVRRDRVRVE